MLRCPSFPFAGAGGDGRTYDVFVKGAYAYRHIRSPDSAPQGAPVPPGLVCPRASQTEEGLPSRNSRDCHCVGTAIAKSSEITTMYTAQPHFLERRRGGVTVRPRPRSPAFPTALPSRPAKPCPPGTPAAHRSECQKMKVHSPIIVCNYLCCPCPACLQSQAAQLPPTCSFWTILQPRQEELHRIGARRTSPMSATRPLTVTRPSATRRSDSRRDANSLKHLFTRTPPSGCPPSPPAVANSPCPTRLQLHQGRACSARASDLARPPRENAVGGRNAVGCLACTAVLAREQHARGARWAGMPRESAGGMKASDPHMSGSAPASTARSIRRVERRQDPSPCLAEGGRPSIDERDQSWMAF